MHRYETGWTRFELGTLSRIAAALGLLLEVRLVRPEAMAALESPLEPTELARELAPLFQERELSPSDLAQHPRWVLTRVLTRGDLRQVNAARAFFSDRDVRGALSRREVDERTRRFWTTLLGEEDQHASPSAPC